MAITISGDGTISGISAGGLPDGCVTNAELAGSIAGSKLADSYLTNVGYSNLPSGSVVQVVRGERTTSVEGTTDFDIMAVNITPKLSNSRMLIQVYVQWSNLGSDGTDWGMLLQRDQTTILGHAQNGYFISGGGVDALDWTGQGSHQYGVNFAAKTDLDTGRTAGTSTIEYKLRRYVPNGSNAKTVRFVRDGWGGSGVESQRSIATIIITEIAA